ncbi:rhomboid family intramembrane serine protease [Solicola sp. PLA-1-18]|uniref:rhomboid family intramembrane serine protease n=1 Tax=Solicola sp. PLA-1-18 TaxID=3380532 RepID=UPI003B7AF8EB
MTEQQGAPASRPAPFCYRHPDRETYISCQRCGRPICPDCMRPASVGFQCPDCVAEGARTIRQPRTVAGGRVSGRVGVVTLVLIGINVVAFLAQYVTGGANGTVTDWGAMLSRSVVNFNGGVSTGVVDGAWWRPLTSAFLHVGLLHIAFNMYALYAFGRLLEGWLGTWRFIAMYLTSALGGSVVVYLLGPTNGYSLGASGAVFGLLGVALVMMHQRRYDTRTLLVLLALNAALPLLIGGISWQAHLGGLLTGLALGAAFAYAPRQARTLVHVGTFAALWVLIVAGFVLRTLALS